MPDRFASNSLSFIILAISLALPACSNNAPPKGKPPSNEDKPAAAALKLNIGRSTHTGKFREINDDAVAVKDIGGATLCVAADGMGAKVGGQDLGQVAAQRAMDFLTRELEKNLPAVAAPAENSKVINRAIVTANEDFMRAAAKGPDMNMGATVVLALWRRDGHMYIAGVGDSRVYLVRGLKIEQLTVDHSLAQALVENNTITAEEARNHRFRNVLWKYLGSKEVGERVDVKAVALQPADRILLCTDGLHGVLADEQIRRCLQEHPDVQKGADALCQQALDAGSRDNVSCIVIEVMDNK